MNPKDYLGWYQSKEFGWKGIDTIQNVICGIRLFPKEVSIARCAIDNCESKEILKERSAAKTDYFEFILEFASLKPNESIFDLPGRLGTSRPDRVTYFSSAIKNDIKGLTSLGDTVECQSVIYEPSLPQKARMLINLEMTKKSIVEIIITDRIISGETFHFNLPELTDKSIPSLKL
ncbi:hypothetical protein D3C87_09690 [compost metagenome]